MVHIRTIRIPIWRALLDGDCKQIAKTEKQLWNELENQNHWYEPENKHRWITVVSDENVPVVKGETHDWSAEGGCGGIHVHYVCPHCETQEYTDHDPNASSPYLWFCERGKGLILVVTE